MDQSVVLFINTYTYSGTVNFKMTTLVAAICVFKSKSSKIQRAAVTLSSRQRDDPVSSYVTTYAPCSK